jgi:pimeloyl-ACP methyl ester carboxylesterase
VIAMTAVFVHGVPESPQLWDSLRAHLGRTDISAPRLPGFGCPRPGGFGATKEDYVGWLVGELERHAEPVDLVGHDWGGGFVVRVVSTRPELVRSWVTDAAGLADVRFEWHEYATIWQTPEAGEAYYAEYLALPEDERIAFFEQFGIARGDARTMVTGLDATMAECILALYRSAVGVGREWAPDFRDIPAPGLVLLPDKDPFLSLDSARTAARAAGAQTAELTGRGHWWMLEDPAAGAAALERFWASCG